MSPLIASVVPDVSGIDKVFDYVIPDALAGTVGIGDRVRVNLHGRRIGGWIVALKHTDEKEIDESLRDKLLPIVSLSGHGVEPDLVKLTHWVSEHYFGPWRTVLTQASAPRVRSRVTHRQNRMSHQYPDDEVSRALSEIEDQSGGLLVIPPSASALSVVMQVARRGAVLVVCPTQKMASLGAAYLRRKGFSTAVVPDEWDNARAGVDVVLGARSSVFAPCANVTAIVVIDEHDELLKEERSPTWNARDVAWERARQLGVPCYLTSAIPSAQSLEKFRTSKVVVQSGKSWPKVTIVDLENVPVAGSLLSSEMLASVTASSGSVLCVLNTKGKARMLVCRQCRTVQMCPTCESLVSQNDAELLECLRCHETFGSVCQSCGRTSFSVPRGGMSHLAGQLRSSTGRQVIEISSDSIDDWTTGSVFVGTEAIVHRITRADVVIFADIDRDLGAPRMTAAREVLALVGRAARVVGGSGEIIIQTRRAHHGLFEALTRPDITTSILQWSELDLDQRRLFRFPPFSCMARVALRGEHDNVSMPHLEGIDIARDEDEYLIKAGSREELAAAVLQLKNSFGASVRIYSDPLRY